MIPANINFNSISALIPGQTIMSLHGTAEVDKYPIPNNSEVAFKDADDDTLMYIKTTDANGFGKVKRLRYYEDPEPTEQELNDRRYVTIEDFNKFKSEIKEILNNGRNSGQSNDGAYSNNKRYEKSGNGKFKSNEYASNDVK